MLCISKTDGDDVSNEDPPNLKFLIRIHGNKLPVIR